MRAIAIIGAGFGDEGKGLLTDYFSEKNKNSLIVRFSGGGQSGHTVEKPDGRRHAFAQIGSGTFTEKDTYLSRYFVVNPYLFLKEVKELDFNINKIYINKNCYVTTPYDVLINQIIEEVRGKDKHGTCGIGFGETIERNEDSLFPLKVVDLLDEEFVKATLWFINSKYLERRLSKLGVKKMPYKFIKIRSFFENIDLNFIRDIREFLKHVIICDDEVMEKRENIIFEGSQGLLLDQNSKFFPHVTRSNTGLTNIEEMIKDINIDVLDVIYVSRSYTTKHGEGPLPFELKIKPYEKIVDKTNEYNDFQGRLRFSYLNLDPISQAIKKDIEKVSIQINPMMAFTCLDQLGENVNIIIDNKIISCYKDWFSNFYLDVSERYKIKTSYLSYGPRRTNVIKNIKE